MRFFSLLACVMSVALFLSGCSPTGVTDDFAYSDTAFSATIQGTLTRLSPDGYRGGATLTGDALTGVAQSLEATVTVGAPGGGGARDLIVTFTSPPALAGLTVALTHSADSATRVVTLTRTAPGGTIILDDRSAPGTYDALLRFAEILLPVGDITATSPTQAGCHTVTRRSSGAEIVYTFEEGTLLPLAVRSETAYERLDLRVFITRMSSASTG